MKSIKLCHADNKINSIQTAYWKAHRIKHDFLLRMKRQYLSNFMKFCVLSFHMRWLLGLKSEIMDKKVDLS
jgi:hypothetical protein